MGKYDLMYKGKKFFFDISPYGEGYKIEYQMEVAVPEFMQGIMPNRVHATCKLVVLKWWEKLLGFDLDKKLKKEAKKFHSKLKEGFERSNHAENLRDLLNHETL